MLVTHRLQDAFVMATHHYDAEKKSMQPIADNGLDPNTSFLVLNDGKVVFDGTTHDLVHSDDPFLKEYLA
jgi:phospholipid/cholesterol/gamma-HCH transport system ATP-binding protein